MSKQLNTIQNKTKTQTEEGVQESFRWQTAHDCPVDGTTAAAWYKEWMVKWHIVTSNKWHYGFMVFLILTYF